MASPEKLGHEVTRGPHFQTRAVLVSEAHRKWSHSPRLAADGFIAPPWTPWTFEFATSRSRIEIPPGKGLEAHSSLYSVSSTRVAHGRREVGECGGGGWHPVNVCKLYLKEARTPWGRSCL